MMREIPVLLAHAPGTIATLGAVMLNPILQKNEFLLESVIEPVPNRESRVSLGAGVDRLGLNQVRIDWRLTRQDHEHLQTLNGLIVDSLCQSGVACVIESDPAAVQLPEIVGCWHHMGTTRMHEDPHKDIVDADCRIHGVGNVYVAGSSVFPTVGSDSPTITLVALALRLADKIAAELSPRIRDVTRPAAAGALEREPERAEPEAAVVTAKVASAANSLAPTPSLA